MIKGYLEFVNESIELVLELRLRIQSQKFF